MRVGHETAVPSRARMNAHRFASVGQACDSYGQFRVVQSSSWKTPFEPPTAALRLNEMSESGAGWGTAPLISQMNLQPFQPFKDFAPFQLGTAAPTREVGISVNGAKILGGFEKPAPVVKPSTFHKKRVEAPASTRITAVDNQAIGAELSEAGDRQPWDGQSAKRPRHTVEDWPNPDLEEEQRMREEGGGLRKAREAEMMGLMYREGIVRATM